ncbi:MAG TPA: polysaccharide biosynthesis/export family protein [Verrucomicrobiae bacterium]|jgi:polysaccharide export outer membrane protein|nr:polysaccharide biosynthesis/export family protein [Verrucomicrobiae bacterium]
MKKIICQFCKWPFLRHSIITLALFTAAGCSTAYYDPDGPGSSASGKTQTASDQGAFGNVDNPQSDSSAPQPTILRQGDVVKISFPGAANLDETEQIRLDGKIAMPLVGDVQAAGLTPDQLQQNLIKLYAPQVSSSDVTVAIESSSFPVYVTGCVLSPGRVLSDQPLTALEAVMEAGGFDYSRANLRKVHVIRRENDTSQSYVLNLKGVLKGDDKNDFFLQPNDIIYVPEKFSWF